MKKKSKKRSSTDLEKECASLREEVCKSHNSITFSAKNIEKLQADLELHKKHVLDQDRLNLGLETKHSAALACIQEIHDCGSLKKAEQIAAKFLESLAPLLTLARLERDVIEARETQA